MKRYIVRHIIPVLVVMAAILAVAGIFESRRTFAIAVLVCVGFLLGWANAFISLRIYRLYK